MDTIKELFRQGIDKILAIAGIIFLFLSLFKIDDHIYSPSRLDKVDWQSMSVGILLLITAIFISNKDKCLLLVHPKDKQADDKLLSCLYTLSGVKRGVDNIRFDGIYQNFSINNAGNKIENRNVVHFLWTDVRMGSSINAEIVKDIIDSPFLRVYFKDNQCSYQSNISIFPQDKKATGNYKQPLSNIIKYRYLKINCRVPRDVPHDDSSGISFGLRLLDKNLTYWEYICKNLPINIGNWQDVCIDLGNYECWSVFNKDGNYFTANKMPDFTIIAGVVLIFGFFREDFPGLISGHGVTDIKKIWLDNSP